jgi:hypothetical protein
MLHWRARDTFVVCLAATLNVADPLHVTVPSVDVALTLIVYPVPEGMPPTRKLTEALFATLTVPDCTTVDAPFGPVIVQVSVLMTCPPGSVSRAPTDPMFSAAGVGEDVPAPGCDPLEEQPG